MLAARAEYALLDDDYDFNQAPDTEAFARVAESVAGAKRLVEQHRLMLGERFSKAARSVLGFIDRATDALYERDPTRDIQPPLEHCLRDLRDSLAATVQERTMASISDASTESVVSSRRNKLVAKLDATTADRALGIEEAISERVRLVLERAPSRAAGDDVVEDRLRISLGTQTEMLATPAIALGMKGATESRIGVHASLFLLSALVDACEPGRESNLEQLNFIRLFTRDTFLKLVNMFWRRRARKELQELLAHEYEFSVSRGKLVERRFTDLPITAPRLQTREGRAWYSAVVARSTDVAELIGLREAEAIVGLNEVVAQHREKKAPQLLFVPSLLQFSDEVPTVIDRLRSHSGGKPMFELLGEPPETLRPALTDFLRSCVALRAPGEFTPVDDGWTRPLEICSEP